MAILQITSYSFISILALGLISACFYIWFLHYRLAETQKLYKETRNKFKVIQEEREINQIFRNIFDKLDELIYIADPVTYQVLYANKSLKKIMGEIDGRKCYEFVHQRSKVCEFCTNAIILHHLDQPCIWEFYNPTVELWYQCIDRAIKWVDGRWVRYEMAIDIQDIKNIETDLIKALGEANQAVIAKSQFLSVMSHEIRTPMNAIIGMAELLKSTQLNQKQSNYADTIYSSGKSLLTIINDILDFSKIDADKMELDNKPFNPMEIVQSVIAMLSFKSKEKKLKLGYNLAPEIPDYLVGDSGRLRQILVNLIGNAIKFTEKGRVGIDVSLVEKKENKVSLKFIISDTGIGIPRNRHGRLFKLFSQVDTSARRKFGGTGLGLSISKRLIEMMDGEIIVESEEGKGSRFCFTASFDRSDITPKKEIPPVEQIPSSQKISLADKKILLAEDNKTNRILISEIFKHKGCLVELVNNGLEALKALESKSYDLVLMDVEMPEMDGLEATRRIRSRESKVINKNVPILALTAYAMEEDIERCRKAGMDDYLSKPIDSSLLFATIDKILSAEEKEKYPVLDYPDLLKRLGGAEETAKCLLLDLDEEKELVQQLSTMLKKGQREKAQKKAHTLKGTFANLSACRLAKISRELEKELSNTDDKRSIEIFERLQEEFKIFCQLIEKRNWDGSGNNSISR